MVLLIDSAIQVATYTTHIIMPDFFLIAFYIPLKGRIRQTLIEFWILDRYFFILLCKIPIKTLQNQFAFVAEGGDGGDMIYRECGQLIINQKSW